jgi:hypothetical protein
MNTRSEASPPVIDEEVVARVEATLADYDRIESVSVPIVCADLRALLDRIAALEAGCTGLVDTREVEVRDAYRRGWSEAIETMREDCPEAEAPHKDAMNEGCGTFLAEWHRTALRGDREQGEG